MVLYSVREKYWERNSQSKTLNYESLLDRKKSTSKNHEPSLPDRRQGTSNHHWVEESSMRRIGAPWVRSIAYTLGKTTDQITQIL